MGCYLLTELMSYRHQLRMSSYDRLSPNQWTYLASLPRLSPESICAIVAEATRTDRVIDVQMSAPEDHDDAKPWTRPPSRKPSSVPIEGPLPAEVGAILAQRLFVEKDGLPSPLINRIKRLAAFQNPEFYKKQKMRLSTATTPRVICCVDPKAIGRIGGGKNSPTGRLDVAMIQSLVRKGEVNNLVACYGHVIVDECHHLPAVSFERVLSEVKARYVTGLTATPYRRDGHQPIIHMQLGPVRFAYSRQRRAAALSFEQRLIVRETNFDAGTLGPDAGIQEIYATLAADDNRNMLIFDDVLKALDEGRSPILLTERTEHLDRLAERFRKFTRHLVVVKGGMTTRDRKKVMEHLASIPGGEGRLVLATGRYIGEGSDDARLDTLSLALPVSWKGTLVQYAGRLHRQSPEKREVRIYDYVGRNVPMLARMFEKRMKGYRALGYGKPNSPASNRHRQPPSGGASRPGDSCSSGCLTLSESIRAASEIPFEVDLVEKSPWPRGAKDPRRK